MRFRPCRMGNSTFPVVFVYARCLIFVVCWYIYYVVDCIAETDGIALEASSAISVRSEMLPIISRVHGAVVPDASIENTFEPTEIALEASSANFEAKSH